MNRPLSSGDVVCIRKNHVLWRERGQREEGYVGKFAVVLCASEAVYFAYVLIDSQLLELWVGTDTPEVLLRV